MNTLTPEHLNNIDAYWRAANYLSVAQIYLRDNPLLREPLTRDHVKPRLLGHWGTTPGLNFIYAHLNRMIRERNQSTLYIPADRSDEWVGVYGKSTIEKTFGADSETVARDWFDSITAENGTAPDVLRAEGGDFYNDNDNDFDEAMFALLPRDPRMLLNRIYLVTLGTGPSADAQALVFIGDSLRTGLVPADLRAAFYRAAALIPGVTLTEGQATLDGRTGVAIGRFEPGWQSRQEIIIDPDTGLMIGEREISYVTDADFPPGTVWRWTSIVTTVESSAPTGGSD